MGNSNSDYVRETIIDTKGDLFNDVDNKCYQCGSELSDYMKEFDFEEEKYCYQCLYDKLYKHCRLNRLLAIYDYIQS